jgi:hypothetical protein
MRLELLCPRCLRTVDDGAHLAIAVPVGRDVHRRPLRSVVVISCARPDKNDPSESAAQLRADIAEKVRQLQRPQQTQRPRFHTFHARNGNGTHGNSAHSFTVHHNAT